MKSHEPSFCFSPVSLLTILFLLSAVPAFADHPGSMNGYSEKTHPNVSRQKHWDSHRSSRHDGMHKKRGEGHYSMHSSEHKRHHAEGRHGHDHHSTHHGHHQDAKTFIKHILKFKEGMSLTEDQVQQLRSLKTQYKKNRIRMKAEVQLAGIDLQEVLKDEKASLSDVEAKMNAVHALKIKLHMTSIKAKRDAKAVLSEEQRARMNKIHERIKSHGGNMAHEGGYSKYKKNKGHETSGHMK